MTPRLPQKQRISGEDVIRTIIAHGRPQPVTSGAYSGSASSARIARPSMPSRPRSSGARERRQTSATDASPARGQRPSSPRRCCIPTTPFVPSSSPLRLRPIPRSAVAAFPISPSASVRPLPHPATRLAPTRRRPPDLSDPILIGFSGLSRKGGPARSGGPPFLESPGLMRDLVRRRGGGPFVS